MLTALPAPDGGSGDIRLLVITKFRYMGDTIVATPFLRCLHEACAPLRPRITLLSGPAMPTLLQGCPYVEEVWPFDPKARPRFANNRQLIERVRAARFHGAFVLNRSLHSALVAWLGHIPARIGFDTEHRGPLLTTRVPYDWRKTDRECALDLLRAVGAPAENGDALPELWVSEAERAEARALLADRGTEAGGLLVAMQPGAHDPEVREWGAERFAEVGARLTRERAASVVLLGSAEERTVAERVAAAMEGRGAPRPVILAGETGLRQALSVLSLSDLWVGNDGGMLHAAVALGPATVGIFGPTKAGRWSYDLPRHRTMVVHPPDGAKDAATIRRCLDGITPESVYAASIAALETKEGQ